MASFQNVMENETHEIDDLQYNSGSGEENLVFEEESSNSSGSEPSSPVGLETENYEAIQIFQSQSRSRRSGQVDEVDRRGGRDGRSRSQQSCGNVVLGGQRSCLQRNGRGCGHSTIDRSHVRRERGVLVFTNPEAKDITAVDLPRAPT